MDPNRWAELIAGMAGLPPSARGQVTDALKALATKLDSEDDQQRVWEALRRVVARHREFPDAAWALPDPELSHLEELLRQLQPALPEKRFGWHFNDHVPDIPHVRLRTNPAAGQHDFNAYQGNLESMRIKAAAEIAESPGGWRSIEDFVQVVKFPEIFGSALAQTGHTEFDEQAIDLLQDEELHSLSFAQSYLGTRFRQGDSTWLSARMARKPLSSKQIARLLLTTGDFPTAWETAEACGLEVAQLFWREFHVWGLGSDFGFVLLAASRLLDVGRHAAALELLQIYASSFTGTEHERERTELIATGLEQLTQRTEADPEMGLLTQHDIAELLRYLAGSNLAIERLARLEWMYLGALGFNASPVALVRLLASDPDFFVDVIVQVYRPENDDDRATGAEESTEESREKVVVTGERTQQQAEHAHRLLWSWRVVPGSREDGTVDFAELTDWVTRARGRLKDLSRLGVGDTHIGHALAWSPPGDDGIWPALPVRELLEVTQSEDVKNGMRSQLFNNRGAWTRDLLEGGDQERGLSAKYREQAGKLVDRWPRTAAVLRSLAGSYESLGRGEDDDAERTHRGLR